ncbi:MAG: HAD family phosphatase [Candidatus Magasanikbacteria bacterium]|jgi:epoxide hydrolase-like predicted phosphatase|nr:HAD family phosphatase [Candidatus Magasanikbacteria bacterium]MBT4071732.1 HAD family phosphatase [Candidatus Magasanikbacteria bacterium]
MKITTLIFDLGHVVLTNDWHDDCPEKFQAYSDYFGITYDDMERGWDAFWPQFSTGKVTEDEFWNGFLKIAGAKKIDIKQAKKLWKEYQKPIEDMLGLLQKLKKHNRLAALTTLSREWLDYKRKKYDLDSYFEVIVSSGYSGLVKPDPKIYKMVVKQLNVKPGECLFIDDAQRTLPPAGELGMKTILFSGQSELERNLQELGIKY